VFNRVQCKSRTLIMFIFTNKYQCYYHGLIDLAVSLTSTNRPAYISVVEPTRCTFCITFITASTCFKHYLLIFRRRSINNWYIACVLCRLAAARVGVSLQPKVHLVDPTYTVQIYYDVGQQNIKTCICLM
jgi:hypothetical protein